MARVRGCDGKPADFPVSREEHEGKLYIWWNCPSKFIPISIYKWWKLYKFYRKFNKISSENYLMQKSIYLEAVNLYENELTNYANKK